MSNQLLSRYLLRSGSQGERETLLKFLQLSYQELFPEQEDFSHLTQTVKQYLSRETPLWWVELADVVVSPSDSIMPHSPRLNQPVACLWMGNAIDQIHGDRYAHVFLLYVLPEHRRQGIAKALLHQAQEWARARGDRQIGLQVFQSNKPALSLYHQLGFQTQSLWMVKSLYL